MSTASDERAPYESNGAKEKSRKRPFRPGLAPFFRITCVFNSVSLFEAYLAVTRCYFLFLSYHNGRDFVLGLFCFIRWLLHLFYLIDLFSFAVQRHLFNHIICHAIRI